MDRPDTPSLALGLPGPHSAQEAEDAASVSGMRRAIERGARTSRLVRECLEIAEELCLSREEVYVLIAYRSLVELEQLRQSLGRTQTRHSEALTAKDPDGHF